jgi:hypothetical protein
MDCGLILEKPRSLNVKCLKYDFPGIVFLNKTHGSSPRVHGLRRPGPPWTGGHCRSRELTGARPPAVPVPESSDRGVGERKGGPATDTLAQKDDSEGAMRAKRGGIGGVGGFTKGGVGFYRAEARRGRVERLQLSA